VKLSITIASPADAAAVASLANQVADDLTIRYGKGHWSYHATEKGVLYDMKGNSKLLLAKNANKLVGTLRLTTKKPWAIDPSYFTEVIQPLYLVGMAVDPAMQRKGIGRYMMQEAKSFATVWPAHSIRLDAYDAAAGAGEFYTKCGYTEKGRVVYKENPLIYFELLL
jgi:GNAT superfamily N-acetyltransferase